MHTLSGTRTLLTQPAHRRMQQKRNKKKNEKKKQKTIQQLKATNVAQANERLVCCLHSIQQSDFHLVACILSISFQFCRCVLVVVVGFSGPIHRLCCNIIICWLLFYCYHLPFSILPVFLLCSFFTHSALLFSAFVWKLPGRLFTSADYPFSTIFTECPNACARFGLKMYGAILIWWGKTGQIRI